jgi:hypothetical protein
LAGCSSYVTISPGLRLPSRLEVIMAKLSRIISGILATLLLVAVPVFAYEVTLKDGRVIQFQKYRVTETALLYIDEQGGEISIPLDSVDVDRTRELNIKENPPLNLPGLITTSASGNVDSQPSLGEIARKLRKKDATATSRRVLSNDDVASAPLAVGGGALPLQNSNPDTWQARLDSYRATAGPLENMDSNKLTRAVLGDLDVDFPGRREWEEELSSRKQAVVTALQTASRQYEEFYRLRDALKLTPSISKGDEDKLSQARMAAESAINQAQVQQSRFEITADKGKQRALEWRRK